MKHFHTIEKHESGESHPHFGICPRCKEEHFLSVPTLEYGLICLYCLYDLYPPNGLPRCVVMGEGQTDHNWKEEKVPQ